jgi:hypothetical protein
LPSQSITRWARTLLDLSIDLIKPSSMKIDPCFIPELET